MCFYDQGGAPDQKKSKITPLAQTVKKLQPDTKNGGWCVVMDHILGNFSTYIPTTHQTPFLLPGQLYIVQLYTQFTNFGARSYL